MFSLSESKKQKEKKTSRNAAGMQEVLIRKEALTDYFFSFFAIFVKV